MTKLPRDLELVGRQLEEAVQRKIERRRTQMAAARLVAAALAAIPIALITVPAMLSPSTGPSTTISLPTTATPSVPVRTVVGTTRDRRAFSERALSSRRPRGAKGEIHPLDSIPPPGQARRRRAPAPADGGRHLTAPVRLTSSMRF